MSVNTQIIVSAKDMATGTMRRIGLVSRNLTNELFSMRNALMGGAVAGMAALVRQSIEATDQIGKVADKVGLTTDQLQELRYSANLAGVAQAQLDMGMQRFSRRLGEVSQGQGELLKTSKQYGVELRNADGSMRSNIDLLGDWSEVIKNAESDQEALRIAFKLFDSEGAALVNMLRGGSEGLKGMRREARELGLVIDESLVRSSEKANDQLTKMEMLLQARLRSTLAELSPDIIELANSTFEWVRANRELLTQDVPGYVRKIIENVKSFNGIVAGSAEGGLLQTAGLGYIGYRLFGAGPGKIIAALYVIKRGTDELEKGMEAAAKRMGLLLPDPKGYKKSSFSDLLPGGSADKAYREFMWGTVPDVLSGKRNFSGELTEDYKAVLEAARQGSVPKSLLMARPPEASIDPRDRDYSAVQPQPWYEPSAPATPMTDQQLKLQESLNREIKRLTMDQFAFARAEAERTYQKDLEIAGKSEELVAQAGERRRLSLASIAEEETKQNRQQAEQAAQAQRDLTAEIERATLGRYEAQRRETKRYYDDLVKRAEAAGLETVSIEQGRADRIAEINEAQREDARRTAEEMSRGIKEAHIRMLESSDSMADGFELAMERMGETSQSVAEKTADVWQSSTRQAANVITDALMMQEVNFGNFLVSLQRKAMNTWISEPLVNGLMDFGGSLFKKIGGFASGGISYGPQLTMVSEGSIPVEAHVPLPDGRTIPVTVSGLGGGQGGIRDVKINIYNQGGQPMDMGSYSARFDETDLVIDCFLEGLEENRRGVATLLQGGQF
ncbi:hypothetical protein [Pseudodesulfovibrio karagichevae]|uniref:Uncharacterized protein n=1 Tax=Pseudodesulfovibrio karagichevae TaxID=3239305 RepID=A0ABV4K2A1_9BACT